MRNTESRWLVIEDEVPILRALESHTQALTDVRLEAVSTAERARNRLHLGPLRCVSFDLRLPDRNGYFETSVGNTLLNEMLPLTKRIVYTGFRTSEDGLSALVRSGREGFLLLAKGARNAVEKGTATATPLGWCALMLHLVGHQLPGNWHPELQTEARAFLAKLGTTEFGTASTAWHRSYWSEGPRYLPQPLAEAAMRYDGASRAPAPDAEPMVSREALLAVNEFREWTLWLAAAQTAVLMRQQKVLRRLISAGDGRGVMAAHHWLLESLHALHGMGARAPGALSWCRHLRTYAPNGPAKAHASVVLDALETLRLTRNEGVHGLRPRPLPESQLTGLRDMMDLASYWASNPFLNDVRRERGALRAKALCGKEPVDLVLPDDVTLPSNGVDAHHIYQMVWRFSSTGLQTGDELDALGQPEPVLLDWWPYLRWTFNREAGTNDLVLLTVPATGDGSVWHAQALSGAHHKVRLTPDERRALQENGSA